MRLSQPVLLTVVLLACLSHGIAHGEDPPAFILEWGSFGTGDGQFDFPRRLAVDADGNVFVADRNNNRIQKFTNDGVFVTKWGSLGTGDGQFNFPFGVAAGATGHVYVAERSNNRVQKFTNDGTFVVKWGSAGTGDGEFDFPVGIAVDRDGHVYVADSFNHRIQKFTSQGGFLTKWGSNGSSDGQFDNPVTLAVDSDNHVYVGDAFNHRVQKFTSSGVFVTKWGSFGSGEGQFGAPRGIGVDGSDNIYVVDQIYNRVQKFTSDGTFLTQWGTAGSGDGEFIRPEDVDVGPLGNVFVTDPSNNRVQKFGFVSVPVTLTSFTVERVSNGALVRWQVSHGSLAVARFYVHRSTAGGLRARIGGEAVGQRNTYELVDTTAPADEAEYWLEELDRNGVRYWHGPVPLPPASRARFGVTGVFPNPFNPAVTIRYSLAETSPLQLAVYDVRGRLVRRLATGVRPAGPHAVVWDGRDEEGRLAGSGVYFVRLRSGALTQSRKIALLK